MNFSSMSPEQIHLSTVQAAKNEKAATIILLDHLVEVSERKIYARYNYGTLMKYVVKELGYTENEASVRISAMRLMVREPEVVRPVIANGSLPISKAALIEGSIKGVPGKPSLGAIKAKIKDDIKKPFNQLKDENRKSFKTIIISEKLQDLISKLGWTEINDAEAFEALVQEKLLREKVSGSRRGHADDSLNLRKIPKETIKAVLERSGHKCEHTGCSERRNLEFAHIKAFSKGGDRSPENIRMLCWAHNQLEAIEEFGIFKSVI